MANVLTVSQFVESVRDLLRETFSVVTVQGEVTGYRTARNGTLVYFELKDTASRVLCFALSHEVKVRLTDGMEIKVTGSPSLFKGNGGFHLRVIEVELVGEGALRKQFELTKKRLESEGLFRFERKRVLPVFPDVIGLITSPDAAAYSDVLRILKNRWPLVKVKLAGVAVQGPGASRQIVQALRLFSDRREADVVILTRGGGSLEDLQAFNDEIVARAIFGSGVPVVVGVGHERDETIADYVADVRASTPSNAAERVVPDRVDVLVRLEASSARISRALASAVELERRNVDARLAGLDTALQQRLHSVDILVKTFFGQALGFRSKIVNRRQAVSHQTTNLALGLKRLMGDSAVRLIELTRRLRSLSPTAILQRGYSITRTANGKILRNAKQTAPGDSIRTTLGSGEISSTVTNQL